MKLNEIVDAIHSVVPEPAELNFDKVGVINKPKRDIKSVAICMDLTPYAVERLKKSDVDFMIVHHGKGRQVRRTLKDELDMGGYGLHLALDVVEGGIIDAFASVLKVRDRQNIPFTYKGITVEKAAVMGDYKRGFDGTMEEVVSGVAKRFNEHCSKKRSHYSGCITNIQNPDKTVAGKVIAAPGKSISSEFLKQTAHYQPDVIVGGSVRDGALEVAQDLGISIVTTGDYLSHYPWLGRIHVQNAACLT